jgi:AcrR family transcriptional regulator
MVYRRSENAVRRLSARHDAIVAAARRAASEGGMGEVRIAPIAARAGIAAGTVYRYFLGKSDLVGALIAIECEHEIAAMRSAAARAPGPLSALAAVIVTFAARALRHRRLAFALLAEPSDADIERRRRDYRAALTSEIERCIDAAVAAGHLPAQDAGLAARALVGGVIESLVGPLAPERIEEPAVARAAVHAVALLALRGLGIADARARGLVLQTAWPQDD